MILNSLIKSKTRIKLLLKFFINPDINSYLRQLSKEFNESTNAIRIELNSLTKAKILLKNKNGKTISYKANKDYPLFDDIRNIILKSVGLDKIISLIIDMIGRPDYIILTGDYSKGIDAGIIDLIIVGNSDKKKLDKYIVDIERMIDRKIRYIMLNNEEFENLKTKIQNEGMLILWKND